MLAAVSIDVWRWLALISTGRFFITACVTALIASGPLSRTKSVIMSRGADLCRELPRPSSPSRRPTERHGTKRKPLSGHGDTGATRLIPESQKPTLTQL